MADQFLTEQQLEDAFRGVTLTITGLADKLVRIAYQGQGQPGREIAQNLVFINVSTMDDPWDKLRDILFVEKDADYAEEEVSYTRVIQVDWSLYGPEAFNLGDLIRHGILLESNRRHLAGFNIFPITGIPAPTKQPYPFNNQWWQRVDLRAFFNVHTIRRRDVPYLVGADVSLYTDDGLQQVVQIRED